MTRRPAEPDDANFQADDVVPRFAARLEDRFHRFRARRARARGLTAIVIPYEGYGAVGWMRVLARVVLARQPSVEHPATAKARYQKIRGWRSFTSIAVAGARVTIEIDGVEHEVYADRGGVVDQLIPHDFSPGWHTIALRTEQTEAVDASVFVVDETATIGIVCDIDDTVMVTALPRPLLAAWNTFVLDEHARTPVPGMAVMLEKLVHAHPGAPVVYLSTGAWNVAPTLKRFLGRHLYPSGPLLLTDWGPTHDRWFRSGAAHKSENLRRLASEFPWLRWVLIGDDGQHDERLYAEFADEHPGRVAAVAIRQLSSGEAVLAGGRAKHDEQHDEIGVRWVYATDGAGIADQLRDHGLL